MIEIVDVSNWQGTRIDAEAVAADGIAGAYVKATQGTGYVSPAFLAQWIAFRSARLRVGAYHFLSHDVPAREQARHFLDTYRKVSGEPRALPPALDVETAWLGGDPRCADAAATWLGVVSDALGVAPMVYTYAAFARAFRSQPELGGYRLWLARFSAHETWPPAPPPWGGEPALWQWTGSGRVAGIVGDVDRSRARALP